MYKTFGLAMETVLNTLQTLLKISGSKFTLVSKVELLQPT